MRKQVVRIAVNAQQIVERFTYYSFLDRLLNGVFGYSHYPHNKQCVDILNSALLLMEGIWIIYESAANLFLDEKIMKKEEDMTDIKINPKALRHEYLANGTSVSRKIEIIRTLYMAGFMNLIPTEDQMLYKTLYEAKQRHAKKHEDFVDKLMER